MELIIFHKIYASINTIKLVLLITNLHSKDLERSKGDMGAKKKTLFDIFNRALTF